MLKKIHYFTQPPIIIIFLLPQREEGRKEQGQKIGKQESPKSELDTGVSDLGAFKLDHLQPAKLILFRKCSTFFTQPPIINLFLLPQLEEGAGAEIGKTE